MLKLYLTEKSTTQSHKDGKYFVYAFTIPNDATKDSVYADFKRTFGVEANKVNIVNLPVKKTNFRRVAGVFKRGKRAYVYTSERVKELTA